MKKVANRPIKIRIVLVMLLSGALLLPICACSQQKSFPEKTEEAKEIRSPVVAGAFYPGSSKRLSQMVDEFLGQAKKISLPGRIVALIAPHAGYVYSGKTAGWAFKQLEGSKVNTVFLLGPTHRAYFPGVSIYGGDGYRTPLGVVPVDKKLASWIREQDGRFNYYPRAHAQEHCLEVELPFLQKVLKDFEIVPMVIGEADRDSLETLGKVLAEAMKRETRAVIVCSTDMTHFPPYEDANRIDKETLEAIKTIDLDKVVAVRKKYIRGIVPNLSCTLCGENAVLATMKAAEILGVNQVEILHYSNSGDIPIGDKNRVVGYGAVVFVKKEEKMAKFDYEGELNEASQMELLKIARESLETYIRTGKPAEINSNNPALQKKRGVFVTLNKMGNLRGCMGHFEQDTPLYQIVARQVVVSSTRDPRFPPVRPDELADIDIEISVLSVPEYVDSYEDIVVGKHGVILEKGIRGATFLPQVAPEQGWNRETMLSHLASKAGLPPDGWRRDCKFQVYTAQVFGEHE